MAQRRRSTRRAHRRYIDLRLQGANFHETCRLQRLRKFGVHRHENCGVLNAAFSLESLCKASSMSCLVGPAGVPKSFLTQSLRYNAVRAWSHRQTSSTPTITCGTMAQARVDNSLEQTFQ